MACSKRWWLCSGATSGNDQGWSCFREPNLQHRHRCVSSAVVTHVCSCVGNRPSIVTIRLHVLSLILNSSSVVIADSSLLYPHTKLPVIVCKLRLCNICDSMSSPFARKATHRRDRPMVRAEGETSKRNGQSQAYEDTGGMQADQL